jgi:hypothetical protein
MFWLTIYITNVTRRFKRFLEDQTILHLDRLKIKEMKNLEGETFKNVLDPIG